MSKAMMKMAPSAVALALGGYLVWPLLDDSASSAPSTSKSGKTDAGATKIPSNMLDPEMAPFAKRDPFLDGEAMRSVARATLKKMAYDLAARLTNAKEPPKRTFRPRRGGSTGSGDKANGDELSGFTLNATYIQKGKAAAVINGRVVSPGQKLGESDVLQEVKAQSVVILHKGKPIELAYRAAAGGGGGPRPIIASRGRAAPTRRVAGGRNASSKSAREPQQDPFDLQSLARGGLPESVLSGGLPPGLTSGASLPPELFQGPDAPLGP